jgi:hypothetical protein
MHVVKRRDINKLNGEESYVDQVHLRSNFASEVTVTDHSQTIGYEFLMALKLNYNKFSVGNIYQEICLRK